MVNVPHKISVEEPKTDNDNKEVNNIEDMNTPEEKLKQMEDLLNNVDMKQAPKRKTKIEKKDKGLIERTENSAILLTEDNKMLLND